jgi:hypothetical protein
MLQASRYIPALHRRHRTRRAQESKHHKSQLEQQVVENISQPVGMLIALEAVLAMNLKISYRHNRPYAVTLPRTPSHEIQQTVSRLLAATETKHQVERRLLLDVVVG